MAKAWEILKEIVICQRNSWNSCLRNFWRNFEVKDSEQIATGILEKKNQKWNNRINSWKKIPRSSEEITIMVSKGISINEFLKECLDKILEDLPK